MRCAADDDVARVLTKFLRTACIYCLVAKDDDDWRAGKLSDPLSRDSLACGAVPACPHWTVSKGDFAVSRGGRQEWKKSSRDWGINLMRL